jgi:chromosomal replication initiator protein
MQIWDEIAKELSRSFDSDLNRAILEKIRFKEMQNEKTIVLVAPDPLTSGWFEANYRQMAEALALQLTGKSYTFVVEIAPTQSLYKKTTERVSVASSQAISNNLNPKYTFERFVVGPNNDFAHAAALQVAQHPGTNYNPLFIYGSVALGKTHLIQAIAHYIITHSPEKKVRYVTSEVFANEFIESIAKKNTEHFRSRYRNLDVLIIDDIQFIAGKNHIQEEFFHTFNSIVSLGGQIILTSDRPPEAIKNLEDRLRSRFSGGLIIDIQPPDFELRTAILLIKAKEKNINIEIDAAKIIAEKITDSRALEGTLLSLYAKILGKKDQIDLETVDDYLSSNKKSSDKRVLPGDIIKAVCSYYNIRQSHIKNNQRTQRLALARQVAMYLLRKELGLKLKDIAEFLKRKDHTTVLHAQQKITSLIMKDQNFKKDVDNIIQSFKL